MDFEFNSQPLPKDWIIKTGAELAEKITKGASPRWQGFTYQDYGVLFVTSENVRDGWLDISSPKYLSFAFAEKHKNSKLVKGDILINIVGASIGRSCLFKLDVESNINQAVCLFRPSNIVNPIYILYYLQSPNAQEKIQGSQVESARPNLSLTDIRQFPIPIPPTKAEQTAIATALSDADALISSLERLIAKKRAIKQGAMQKLLKPKEGWLECSLGDICSPSSDRINPVTSAEDIMCIELEHLSSGKGTLLGYTTSKKLLSQKTRFKKGDILFGKLRPYLRKFYLAKIDGVCSTEIWALKPNQIIHNSFLYYIIQSDNVIDAANQSTGTKMPRAEWKIVARTQIFMPPSFNEQIHIAQTLSDMDAEITLLEQKLEKQKLIKQGMMQVLLTGKVRLP